MFENTIINEFALSQSLQFSTSVNPELNSKIIVCNNIFNFFFSKISNNMLMVKERGCCLLSGFLVCFKNVLCAAQAFEFIDKGKTRDHNNYKAISGKRHAISISNEI